MITPPPTPTDEQIETLRDLFFKRIENESPSKIEGSFHPKDLDRVRNSNRWLQLFLEQCELDMKQSLSMLWDTCTWRKKFGTNDINEKNVITDYLTSGIIFPHNKDVNGKILLIFKTKLHVKGSKSVDELIRCLVYWIERLQSQTNYDQLTIFFDMQGSGLSNMDMDFTKRIIDTFKFYYPNSLNYIIIYEMPWVLSAAFKIIKTLLPPKAVARMKFVNAKTMKEFISEDNMLRSWGGTDDYEFEFQPVEEPLQANGISADSLSSSAKKVHFANPSPPESPSSTMAAGAGDKAYSGVGDVELLRITPDDAIFFQKSGNELSGSVEIANISSNIITYKVKTTSPEKFRVRPSTGVLSPNASTTICVGLVKGQEISASSKDKFLVMCMAIGEDVATNSQTIAELWKNTTANSPHVEQHRLKCSLPHSSEDGIIINGSSLSHGSGDSVINGRLNSKGFGTDADRQINHFNLKLSQLTEKTEKLQQQVKQTNRLQWILLLLFLLFIAFAGYIFKDEFDNRQTCSKYDKI